MKEVLDHYKVKINNSKIIKKLKMTNHNYFLVSCHREENIENDDNFKSFVNILNLLASKYNIPIILSTHPRTMNRIKRDKVRFNDLIKLIKPLSFSDYNKLQMYAKVVLSDSGTITEESSILNFPALNIRDSHERPEGMEEAAVMMTGLNERQIFNGISILKDQARDNERNLKMVHDYSDNNVSEKIIRIINSYTDYVNKKIWKK